MEFIAVVESVERYKGGGYKVGLRRTGGPYGWIAVDMDVAPSFQKEYFVSIDEAYAWEKEDEAPAVAHEIPGYGSPSDAAHDAAQEGFVVAEPHRAKEWERPKT